MKIRDVMVSAVVTIKPSASLVEAANCMREANVGVLPVVEDQKVQAVITDRDLVIRALARSADPKATTVAECASTNPICARPDWDIDQAIDVMAREQIGRLPVIDDQQRILGIVTLSSLALRSREDKETLEAAKEVSRRSVKGPMAPPPEAAATKRAR